MERTREPRSRNNNPGSSSSRGRGSPRVPAELRSGPSTRRSAIATRGAWQNAHALRRRLDRVNRTASLVSYEEREENTVPRERAERVRRRMHYSMSLQGFQATVTAKRLNSPATSTASGYSDGAGGGMSAGSAGGGSSSIFMCTPQSFPPTPVSRANVLARTSQFSDDLLFLARDQLRLRENLNGMDETTRATAVFLQGQQRLAVLDGDNSCEGIRLSCGHHRATKTGVSLYSSVRAMVPVLRNRYVYFQVSCVREGMRTPSIGVGLSTPEMPLSTLVGAFSNSIGLCSTGQVLMSSRWYGLPGEYALRKKGMSTVGVLVFLDGSHPFRSWDGDMVRARVYFSVDGRPVHVSPGLGPPIAPDGSAGDGASSAVFNDDDDSPSPKPQEQELEEVAEYVPSPLPPSFSHPSRPGGGGGEDGAGADEEGELSTSDSEEVAPWEAAAASAVAGARAGSVNGGCFGGVMDEESGAIVNVAGTKVLRMAVPACRARAAARSAEERKARGREGEDGKEEREIGQELASLPTAALAPGGSAALGLALPKDRDLFPTVTIHSAKTEIICRFCAPDLLKVSRESMGAPPEATIFALDGSLISRPVITPP